MTKIDSITDVRLREALDECEFLRKKVQDQEEELNKMETVLNDFQINIKNMVLANPDHYREKEIDVWQMFLIFCISEEDRFKFGWLLPEDRAN